MWSYCIVAPFLINRKASSVLATLANLLRQICKLRVERQKIGLLVEVNWPSRTTKTPLATDIINGERHRRDCFTANEVEHAHGAVSCCMFPRKNHSQRTAASVWNNGRPLLPAMCRGRPRLLRHARPQRCQKCEGLMRAPGHGTLRRTMRRYSPCVNTLLNACVLFVFCPLLFFALASRSSCLIHAALQSMLSDAEGKI